MHKILVIFICLFIYVTGFAQTKKNVKSEELFKAVESNDENALIKLLKTGADPSVKDNKGYKPLHYAARGQKYRLGKLLVLAELNKLYHIGLDYLGYTKTVVNLLKETDEIDFLFKPNSEKTRPDRTERREIDTFSILSGGLSIRETFQLKSIQPVHQGTYDIPIDTLKAPEIVSHPFNKMLQGRKYDLPPLSQYIPQNFYFISTPSLTKTLEIIDFINQKSSVLLKKYSRSSIDFHFKDKLLSQLALKENKLARNFYNTVIEEMAIAGSDPFVLNGSDITLLFKLKNKFLFKSTLESYRKSFIESHHAVPKTIVWQNREIKSLTTSDRKVSSYYIELTPDIIVLSNSLEAVKKILACAEKKSSSLAELSDFQYMQSVWKSRDKKGDLTVYLSDAFVRYMVSPELRIRESRRMMESFMLSMLEKINILYYQLTERRAKNLSELLSVVFSKIKQEEIQELEKHYGFEPKSFTAYNREYGRLGYLKPNLEIVVDKVSVTEKLKYEEFVRDYHNFWKDFFDPIGVCINFQNDKLEIETFILPLINLSVYNNIKEMFKGQPFQISSVPKVPGEVLSFIFKFNPVMKAQMDLELKSNSETREYAALLKELGNYLQFNLLDNYPLIDFDSDTLLSEIMLSRNNLNFDYVAGAFMVWSLFHPIRLTIPFSEKMNTQKFSKWFDERLIREVSKNMSHYFSSDFYKMTYHNKTIRVLKMTFFQILTFRLYFLIDNALYVISTENYMKRLVDSLAEDNTDNVSNSGNVMVKIFPGEVNMEKDLFASNIMENFRKTNRRNMATLNLLAILFPENADNLFAKAYAEFGFEINCPAGGQYIYNKEISEFESSVFGTLSNPLIDNLKIRKELDASLFSIKNFAVTLEFTEDGIRSSITLE